MFWATPAVAADPVSTAQAALDAGKQEVIDAQASKDATDAAVVTATVNRDAAQTEVNTAQTNYDASNIEISRVITNGLTANSFNTYGAPTRDESLYTKCATTEVAYVYDFWPQGCNVDGMIHFTGTMTPTVTGKVWFLGQSDDGMQVIVNGKTVSEYWNGQGCRANTSDYVNLVAGTPYSFEVWFFDSGGPSCASTYYREDSVGYWTQIPSSWFAGTTIIYGKDPALLTILNAKKAILAEKQTILDTAISTQTQAITRLNNAKENIPILQEALDQAIYEANPYLSIPTNLQGSYSEADKAITINWTAPIVARYPVERYAIFWSYDNFQSGWGIASTTLSATINDLPYSTTVYIKVRADNDTKAVYSGWSNIITFETGKSPEQKAIELKAQQDAQAAQPVVDLIAAEKWVEARVAYAALTTDQQSYVSNYTVLTVYEKALADAIKKKQDEEAAAKAAADAAEKERLRLEAEAKAKADRLAAEEAARLAEEEKNAATPEPTVPPTEEPTPESTPSQEPTQEPTPTESEPLPEPEQATATEVLGELKDIAPTDLTDAQVEELKDAALATFETAEQGSPQYEAALEALMIVAQADDIVLPAELEGIPGAAEVLAVFNALGNLGADMSPQVREESKQIVVAAVVVGQVAQTAMAAASSAASSGGSSGPRRRN